MARIHKHLYRLNNNCSVGAKDRIHYTLIDWSVIYIDVFTSHRLHS